MGIKTVLELLSLTSFSMVLGNHLRLGTVDALNWDNGVWSGYTWHKSALNDGDLSGAIAQS